MSWITIIGIGIGVAMDAFAVAVVTGLTLRELSFRRFFRLSFHFGLFQCLMPILGWLAGRSIADKMERFDHWIAFGLLLFVGGKMLKDAFEKNEDDEKKKDDPTRGWMLITLSIATSIDALAVGFSLSMLNVSIWMPSVVIGIITASLTSIGMWVGHHYGKHFEKWADILGGIVLIGIGLKILISHLAG